MPHHAARVVVEMSAVGTLELWATVHHLMSVNKLRVAVGVGAVRAMVDTRFATGRRLTIHLQLLRPKISRCFMEIRDSKVRTAWCCHLGNVAEAQTHRQIFIARQHGHADARY